MVVAIGAVVVTAATMSAAAPEASLAYVTAVELILLLEERQLWGLQQALLPPQHLLS